MTISNQASGLRSGVCTSTTRPTAPYIGQGIYETDTNKVLYWNGSAWYPAWNRPWGVVGLATRTAGNLTMTDPAADLTGLTTTFTAISGRTYKASWSFTGQKNATAGRIDIKLLNGSNVVQAINYLTLAASAYYVLTGHMYISSLSGSTTLKLNGFCNAGTASIYADGPANSGQPFLIVEDIGPA